jgi:hypothetical protein
MKKMKQMKNNSPKNSNSMMNPIDPDLFIDTDFGTQSNENFDLELIELLEEFEDDDFET